MLTKDEKDDPQDDERKALVAEIKRQLRVLDELQRRAEELGINPMEICKPEGVDKH